MKWYKRDPDRALAGMAELTLQLRGGYNSLIDLLYARDGDLPDDDTRVARMMNVHRSEWKAVKAKLMACGKVWVEDGNLHCNRVEETIKEASNFGQTQRERVTKRWDKYREAKEINAAPIPRGNTNTPTSREVSKKEPVSQNGGYARGRGVPPAGEALADENLEKFMTRLAKELDTTSAGKGWAIVGSACNDADPLHGRCLLMAKVAAKKIGKGWPFNWPHDHAIFDRIVSRAPTSSEEQPEHDQQI